jgi:hypothetical protein
MLSAAVTLSVDDGADMQFPPGRMEPQQSGLILTARLPHPDQLIVFHL